ncbi:MAG TPA: hypothetical protein VI589_06060 [Vicinamibacteria bacterium]
MSRPWRSVVAALLAAQATLPPTFGEVMAADRDARLERGIRHVEAGEWRQAIVELTEAVRRLSGDPRRKPEAAEACLYSGLAYVGLGETSPAISQFAQALMRDPQIQIPAARETPAARDAFEVARREAVAPPEPKAGRNKVPFVVAGLGAVGAGAALAAGGGGESSGGGNPVPPAFSVTGVTSTPQMLLLSAVPPSSSSINLSQTAPILTFVFTYQANLPGRLRATAEMLGQQGNCITGRTSEDALVDPAVPTYTLVVNSWQITCQGGFTTTSMNVRLIDADAGIPVSLTSYSGGYNFTVR